MFRQLSNFDKGDNHSPIKIGLIFGGTGPEHEAALAGARALLDTIDRNKYVLEQFGIMKNGDWVIGHGTWEFLYASADPDLLPLSIKDYFVEHAAPSPSRFKRFPPSEKFETLDCIFPVLDGIGGEDGTLQGFLSFTQKPIVSCNLLSAAQSFNKYVAKRLVRSAGLRTLAEVYVPNSSSAKSVAQEIERTFAHWDLVIKPNACGSSFGVSRISNPDKLQVALNLARRFDSNVIIEEYLNAVEISVGVTGKHPNITVGEPVINTPLKVTISTYHDKYISPVYSNQYSTSRLPPRVKNQARKWAKLVYKTLDCDSHARIDLFYQESQDQLYFNELNTQPAITPTSAFATGIVEEKRRTYSDSYSYADLLDELIKTTLIRGQQI